MERELERKEEKRQRNVWLTAIAGLLAVVCTAAFFNGSKPDQVIVPPARPPTPTFEALGCDAGASVDAMIELDQETRKSVGEICQAKPGEIPAVDVTDRESVALDPFHTAVFHKGQTSQLIFRAHDAEFTLHLQPQPGVPRCQNFKMATVSWGKPTQSAEANGVDCAFKVRLPPSAFGEDLLLSLSPLCTAKIPAPQHLQVEVQVKCDGKSSGGGVSTNSPDKCLVECAKKVPADVACPCNETNYPGRVDNCRRSQRCVTYEKCAEKC